MLATFVVSRPFVFDDFYCVPSPFCSNRAIFSAPEGLSQQVRVFFRGKKSQSRANSGLLGLPRGFSRFMNGDVLRVCELLSEYYGNNERWNISSFLYLSSVGLRLFGFTISLDFWSLRRFGWYHWVVYFFVFLVYNFLGSPFVAMNLFQLFALVSQLDALLEWLRDKRLLARNRTCGQCVPDAGQADIERRRHFWCTQVRDASKADGAMHRCKYCRKKYSLRYKSFFFGSHLPLRVILVIIYLWINRLRVGQVLGLLAGEVVSNHTVIDWYNFCRDVCSEYLITNPIKLGGVGDIVEIDETHLGGKRKYSRGRGDRYLDMWLFTMIERRRQIFVCVIVPDRSADTLLPLIRQHIEPGTIIYSDEWRSYLSIQNIGYHHDSVNHSVTFVREDGVHTNNIEGVHSLLKADLKIMRGMVEGQIPQYLDEFMFRRNFRQEDLFSKFLEILAVQYPVNDF